jgi:hypothetical protein
MPERIFGFVSATVLALAGSTLTLTTAPLWALLLAFGVAMPGVAGIYGRWSINLERTDPERWRQMYEGTKVPPISGPIYIILFIVPIAVFLYIFRS